MIVLPIFVTSLFASMVLVAALMRVAPRIGLVDRPDERKLHSGVIPRIGGIGMVFGTLVTAVIWLDVDRETLTLLGGIGLIALFALWDDRVGLDYRLKFAGQFAAALLVVLPGGVLIEHLSVAEQVLPHWLSVPLTVVFLVGVTNAMNLSDGLDGLAAGLGILSLLCLVILAELAGAGPGFTLVALSIVGATLGFLRYNTHPAMVFMGDTGSQFLGFCLGVLAVSLTQKVNTAVTPELALLVLGLPVIDTLTVMVQRIAAGTSPFRPDRNHFHHKLLDLGFDHYEAVVAIYAIQSVFVVSAYLLRYAGAGVVAGYYLALAAAVVGLYPLAKQTGWRLHLLKPGRVSALTEEILSWRSRLLQVTGIAIALMIGGFLFAGSAIPLDLAGDIMAICTALAAGSVASRLLGLPIQGALLRLTVYSCGILASYAANGESAAGWIPLAGWQNYYFCALLLAIGFGLRFSGSGNFQITPSDYLMLAVLVMAGLLPGSRESDTAAVLLKTTILLYGIEYVLHRKSHATHVIWVAALLTFAVNAARLLLA